VTGSRYIDRYPLLMRLRFPAVVIAVVLVVGSMTSTLASSQSAGDVLSGAYPVHGIDVSHYQGTVRWSSVASDGIAFAILKATEGQTYVDPTFTYNDGQAAIAGVPVGAYHVWGKPNKSPDEARLEADHFVQVVHPTVGDVLPVLDMEMNRIPDGTTRSTLMAWSRAWLNRVAVKTGVRPMVYGSQYLFQTILGNSTWFADHGFPLWFAWPRTPLPKAMPANDWQGEGWTFWQYSWTGNVRGIHGAVDEDRFARSNLQTALIAELITQPGTGGSITDAAGKIDCAATLTCSALYNPSDLITLTATPGAGYSFVSWGGTCASAGSTPTCTVTTIGAKTVTASFSYTLTVKVNGNVPGTVTSTPTGIDCPGDCTAAFAPGATVPLTAGTDQWTGVTWSGDCTGTDPNGCTVTMDQPRTVTATFADLGPATASLNTPDRRTDPLRVTFDEPVHRLTTRNVVVRPKHGHVVAATLRCFSGSGVRTSCATGKVRRATLTPTAPLDRGKTYLAIVDPAGVTPIVDRVHNPVAVTRSAFSI
jgi:GH25 family lysozyme M1 (1,4-beta-N-acetylmuramidase)